MLSQILLKWVEHRDWCWWRCSYGLVSLTSKPPWMLVFCFSAQPGSGLARRKPWLFHDYQPSSGPTALTSHFGLDLIRSISVNHRVAMSTVTCRAWFCKTSLSHPPLFPTHTNPTHWLFSPFSFLWWCSHHLHHNHFRWECSSFSITQTSYLSL